MDMTILCILGLPDAEFTRMRYFRSEYMRKFKGGYAHFNMYIFHF